MTIRRLITRTTVNTGLMAGVLAFLVQIMAWAVTMPSMALAAAQPATAGVVTTICTADGLKDITLASPDRETADQGTEEPAAKITKTSHCPLCPVMSGAGLPPVDLTAQSLLLPMRADARTLPGDVIAAGWFLSSLQARAPPARG